MSYGSPPPPGPPPSGPPPGPPPPPPGPAPAGGYTQYPPGQSPFGPLANWGQRAAGYLIDWSLLLPGYLLMWLGTPRTGVVPAQSRSAVTSSSGLTVWYFVGLLLVLGVLVWNRWINGGKGQTLGRRVIGEKLIGEQGQPIGTLKAFLRDVAHILDSLICYIGWLFPIWDAKRQTIADKIMNTTVILVPKS